MAEFTVNPTRFDPYKTHMFRVKWDGVYVAGLSKMSALKRSTAPVTHRVGGDPSHDRKSPGLTTYDAVTLERGVTHDVAFEAWANKVSSLAQPGISLADFRKDLIVDVFNEANQNVITRRSTCFHRVKKAATTAESQCSGDCIAATLANGSPGATFRGHISQARPHLGRPRRSRMLKGASSKNVCCRLGETSTATVSEAVK